MGLVPVVFTHMGLGEPLIHQLNLEAIPYPCIQEIRLAKNKPPIFLRKSTSLFLTEVMEDFSSIGCNSHKLVPIMNLIVANAITIFKPTMMWLV